MASKVDTFKKLNILIVYAHHESHKSFNGAVKDIAVKELTKQGHKITVSDLYAMDFKAVCSKEDIKGDLSASDNFKYEMEAAAAQLNGRLTADIQQEQEKVKAADLIIFQFPLYCLSFPAILKGWFERVFLHNFAFTPKKMFEDGLLKGKRAMLSFTTGGAETLFTSDGIFGDMAIYTWAMQYGMLRVYGFDILKPQIFYGVEYLSNEERKHLLAEWEARLCGITKEAVLKFLPNSAFDIGVTFQLKTEYKETLPKDSGHTIGQHLGRPLPQDNLSSDL